MNGEQDQAEDQESRTKAVTVPPAVPQPARPRVAPWGRELAVEIGNAERVGWLGEAGQAVRAGLRRDAARVAPAYAEIVGGVAGQLRAASIKAELGRRYRETWGVLPTE
jgi:hypothetical protein